MRDARKDKEPAVFLHAIERRYQQGDATLDILNGAELAVWPGQSVALIAPSGAGKSTLLHIAGLLEHPDGGEVYIDGNATTTLSRCRAHAHPPHRDRLRLSVPPSAAGILGGRERHAAADDPRPSQKEARKRAAELLSFLGLGERLDTSPVASSPAASSSASRSRARSPMRRASCWPTSRPAISTRAPPSHVFGALSHWCGHRDLPP